MSKCRLCNNKKTWFTLGVMIGFLGGFIGFAAMVIHHSHAG